MRFRSRWPRASRAPATMAATASHTTKWLSATSCNMNSTVNTEIITRIIT